MAEMASPAAVPQAQNAGDGAGIVRDHIYITEATDLRTIAVSTSLPAAMARSHWRLEEFQLQEALYRGKTSLLYHAIDKRSGMEVALKLYRKRKLSTLNKYQVEREIRIHIQLDHPNIIRLFAAFEDEKYVYMVQEFAGGGDLFEGLKRNGGSIKEKYTVRDVIVPFLNALSYLHSKGIIHRDIKPENILLTRDKVIKIADFGLSICIHQERPVTRAGTLDYMAPEVLICPDKRRPEENKDKVLLAYTGQVDAWAAGILCFELLVGRPPFEQESRAATYEHIMYKEPQFPMWMSQEARQFISCALVKNASQRPTIAQLTQQPLVLQYAKVAVPAAVPHAPSTPGAVDEHAQHAAQHAQHAGSASHHHQQLEQVVLVEKLERSPMSCNNLPPYAGASTDAASVGPNGAAPPRIATRGGGGSTALATDASTEDLSGSLSSLIIGGAPSPARAVHSNSISRLASGTAASTPCAVRTRPDMLDALHACDVSLSDPTPTSHKCSAEGTPTHAGSKQQELHSNGSDSRKASNSCSGMMMDEDASYGAVYDNNADGLDGSGSPRLVRSPSSQTMGAAATRQASSLSAPAASTPKASPLKSRLGGTSISGNTPPAHSKASPLVRATTISNSGAASDGPSSPLAVESSAGSYSYYKPAHGVLSDDTQLPYARPNSNSGGPTGLPVATLTAAVAAAVGGSVAPVSAPSPASLSRAGSSNLGSNSSPLNGLRAHGQTAALGMERPALDKLLGLDEEVGALQGDSSSRPKSGNSNSKYAKLFAKMWGGGTGSSSKSTAAADAEAFRVQSGSSPRPVKSGLRNLQEELLAEREGSIVVTDRTGSVIGAPTMRVREHASGTGPTAAAAARSNAKPTSSSGAAAKTADLRAALLSQRNALLDDLAISGRVNSEAMLGGGSTARGLSSNSSGSSSPTAAGAAGSVVVQVVERSNSTVMGKSFTSANAPGMRKLANAPIVNKIHEYVERNAAAGGAAQK